MTQRTEAADSATDAANEPLNKRISRVGRDLATSFGRIVDAIPGQPRGAQGLATALGLKKDLSHRLATALRRSDPLAAVHAVPGPEPLRRVLKAARRRGVPAELIASGEHAVTDFETLIRTEGGDRGGLDAIISEWLPTAREKFETLARQTAYRGMRQLKGLAGDVLLSTVIIHPGEDRHDFVALTGYFGLRRVRPRAQLKLSVRHEIENANPNTCTLDGVPLTDGRDAVLEQFCSDPKVETDAHLMGGVALYTLRWHNAVGLNSKRDVVLCVWHRNAYRAHCEAGDPRPRAGFAYSVRIPARLYIGDLILHKDVYAGRQPTLRVLESGEQGNADPNDPTRELDVLDLLAPRLDLGSGMDRFRVPEIPNYAEILAHVCERTGWDSQAFRGYRARMDFPVYGTQTQFAIDLPERSS